MDKKKQDGYGVGIIFLVSAILLSIFTGNQIITIGWNLSTWALAVLDGVCWVFGIGSLLKPDTFGVIVLRILENYQKSQAEGSDSSSRQTQKQSSGSVQVNARDDAEVHVSVSPREKKQAQTSSPEEVPKNARVFSCPECGHGNTCYPPDDSHPVASSEEDYAKKYALAGYIARTRRCANCGTVFRLYWYQEKVGVGVF